MDREMNGIKKSLPLMGIYCNICQMEIYGIHDILHHIFGLTHPDKNICEVFSAIPIDPRMLIRNENALKPLRANPLNRAS